VTDKIKIREIFPKEGIPIEMKARRKSITRANLHFFWEKLWLFSDFESPKFFYYKKTLKWEYEKRKYDRYLI
jgi:hypothetical protein